MKDFKYFIFEKYITLHNQFLTGEKNLKEFENKLPVYNFYFGKFLPTKKTSKILDLGCGNGDFVFWLQKIGFSNVNGIDLSFEQIELGKKLGVSNLEVADINEYLYNNHAKYDLIFARDVFEHFTRIELYEILRNIKQNLSIGGKLILQVPNGEGIHVNKILYGDITHELAFTKSSMRQLAFSVGFKNINVFPINPFPHGFKSFIRNLLWKYKVLKIKFWCYIEQGSASGIYTSNIILEIF